MYVVPVQSPLSRTTPFARATTMNCVHPIDLVLNSTGQIFYSTLVWRKLSSCSVSGLEIFIFIFVEQTHEVLLEHNSDHSVHTWSTLEYLKAYFSSNHLMAVDILDNLACYDAIIFIIFTPKTLYLIDYYIQRKSVTLVTAKGWWGEVLYGLVQTERITLLQQHTQSKRQLITKV